MKKRELLPLLISLLAVSLLLCACGSGKTQVTVTPMERQAPAPESGTDAPETQTPVPAADKPAAESVSGTEETAPAARAPREKPPVTQKEGQAYDGALTLPEQWYGWWIMTDTEGQWEGMTGYWWDCCAVLQEKDGVYLLEIWDEDMPRDVGLALFAVKPTGSRSYILEGSMLDNTLVLTPESGMAIGQGRLELNGGCLDGENGSFIFRMYLKPWGALWDEAKDQRPYYYESWYLPLIEADKPMPDTIG